MKKRIKMNTFKYENRKRNGWYMKKVYLSEESYNGLVYIDNGQVIRETEYGLIVLYPDGQHEVYNKITGEVIGKYKRYKVAAEKLAECESDKYSK